MLSAEVGQPFRDLGDRFARPPALLESAVRRGRRVGVVRAAGRSALDWGRGVWSTPRVVKERVGSQLVIPLHTFRAWRRDGSAAARRSLESELDAQAATSAASVVGAAELAERLMRFTSIGPALLVGDVRENGLQATLEQHTYDAVQVGLDVAVGGTTSVARTRRAAAIAGATADARWVASAPSAAQATRLRTSLAANEAAGRFWVSARADAALLRELTMSGVRFAPGEILRTMRLPGQKQVLFLERGSNTSGWTHIVARHGDEFARAGLVGDDLADTIMQALRGPVVGYEGTRPVYLVVVGGRVRRIAITVGKNGYIVGANLVS